MPNLPKFWIWDEEELEFKSMVFQVFPKCDENVLEFLELIMEGHGKCFDYKEVWEDANKEDTDFMITLLNVKACSKTKYKFLPNDVYSIHFITAYAKDPKNVKLEKYLMSPSSYKFSEGKTADNVLRREKRWDQISKRKRLEEKLTIKELLKDFQMMGTTRFDEVEDSQDEDGGRNRRSARAQASPERPTKQAPPPAAKFVALAPAQTTPLKRPILKKTPPRTAAPASPAAAVGSPRKALTFHVETVIPTLDARNRVIRKNTTRNHPQNADGWIGPTSDDEEQQEMEMQGQEEVRQENVSGAVAPEGMDSDIHMSDDEDDTDNPEIEDEDEDLGQGQDDDGMANASPPPPQRAAAGPNAAQQQQQQAVHYFRQGQPVKLFSVEDGQKILNLILANNWSRYVMGNNIFRFIEDNCLLEHFIGFRSWSSMQNHFRRVVLKNLMNGIHRSKYRISEDDFKNLKKGIAQKDRARRSGNTFDPPKLTAVKGIDLSIVNRSLAEKRRRKLQRV